MKKPKLTPWFPADVKPVHVGWYHTDKDGIPGTQSIWNWWWNGSDWMSGPRPHGWVCLIQDRTWRGLANPPKETKQKGEK